MLRASLKRNFVTDVIPQFSQFYGFLQPKLKATSHKPSLGSKVLNLLTRNTYKTYSPEDTGEIFQKCKNLTQLKNS
ncbi:15305_t:CDS:1, partial [Acaulospora morrowiae]